MMPTPYDLLSEKLDDETDPDDQLRLMLGQDQGANLAGGPDAQPDGQPDWSKLAPRPTAPTPPPGISGMPQPMAPSPNVAGPLSALAKTTPRAKPHIRLIAKKKKTKPHIKLKASAYG
jgi:hypothetical protein